MHSSVLVVLLAATALALPPGHWLENELRGVRDAGQRLRLREKIDSLPNGKADLPFLHVSEGELLYADAFPEVGDGDEERQRRSVEECINNIAVSLDADNIPQLSSRPNSVNKLFIDVNGAQFSGRAWAGGAAIDALPYKGASLPFTSSITNEIKYMWCVVAEDFAPWDIDVTTIEPADLATSRSVAHALVTPKVDRNGVTIYSCSCGGVAYVGVFGNSNHIFYQPSLTFNTGQNAAAETISHEVGHNLGLSHDGTSSLGYYSGGSTPGWAPIMGVGFNQPLVQWSKGEYPDANNNQDDMAIITARFAQFGTGYRADDAGSSIATAAEMPFNSGYEVNGLIEEENDVDFWEFQAVTNDGLVTVSASTKVGKQANMDIRLEVFDAAGASLGSAEPTNSQDASLVFTPSYDGFYYARVSPTGNANVPYSAYGTRGWYVLSSTSSPTAPCQTNADCTNNLFCDGEEVCVAGNCQPGTPPCSSAGLLECEVALPCDENNDNCPVDNSNCCASNGDCSDGLFCNGVETCNLATGLCSAGSDPCADVTLRTCETISCDDLSDTCPIDDTACCSETNPCPSDNEACTNDVCDAQGECSYVLIPGCEFCGDGICNALETCTSCPQDCDSGSVTAVCGDGVCNGNEDCFSCSQDCNGRTGGKPSNRYCCGSDVCDNDPRCFADGNSCSSAPLGNFCCGDGICNGPETTGTCFKDCDGAPPPPPPPSPPPPSPPPPPPTCADVGDNCKRTACCAGLTCGGKGNNRVCE